MLRQIPCNEFGSPDGQLGALLLSVLDEVVRYPVAENRAENVAHLARSIL